MYQELHNNYIDFKHYLNQISGTIRTPDCFDYCLNPDASLLDVTINETMHLIWTKDMFKIMARLTLIRVVKQSCWVLPCAWPLTCMTMSWAIVSLRPESGKDDRDTDSAGDLGVCLYSPTHRHLDLKEKCIMMNSHIIVKMVLSIWLKSWVTCHTSMCKHSKICLSKELILKVRLKKVNFAPDSDTATLDIRDHVV